MGQHRLTGVEKWKRFSCHILAFGVDVTQSQPDVVIVGQRGSLESAKKLQHGQGEKSGSPDMTILCSIKLSHISSQCVRFGLRSMLHRNRENLNACSKPFSIVA